AAMHANPLLLFFGVKDALINTAVGALVAGLALPRLGGKGSLRATFSVFAYSRITYIVAWFNLGPLPIGAVAAMAYSVYLNIIGLEKLHQLERKMIILFTIILCVIGKAINLRMGF